MFVLLALFDKLVWSLYRNFLNLYENRLNMKFSIVTTTYNSVATVRNTVESVAAQVFDGDIEYNRSRENNAGKEPDFPKGSK